MGTNRELYSLYVIADLMVLMHQILSSLTATVVLMNNYAPAPFVFLERGFIICTVITEID